MGYKAELQENNTELQSNNTDLQSILDAINNLPESAKFDSGIITIETNSKTITINVDHKYSNLVVVQGAAGTISTRCLHWFYSLADGSGYIGFHNSNADTLEWKSSSNDAFPTITYSDTSITIALGAYNNGQIYFQGTTQFLWIAW